MIKVFDFFSGCGGTSQGFVQAGLNVIAGLDVDNDSASTYRHNLSGTQFFQTDIRIFDEKVLSNFMDRDTPILFSGCAPCQPFSRQNRLQDKQDPRRSLLSEFGRFVTRWRPDYVFIENVPGLQRVTTTDGPLATFTSQLHDMGYTFASGVVPALAYGVPQVRERFILIASKRPGITLPKHTHGEELSRPATVEDWIRDLPPIEAGETHGSDPDHRAAKLSKLNLLRIAATPEGGGREAWPKKLWLDCHREHKGHSDVYGRLSWNKPASGLTTRCISYSNGRFGHPEQNRAISVREAACLQTFPRSYKFSGSLESRARQIGNAVPPLMAQKVGEAILAHALKCGFSPRPLRSRRRSP